MKSLVKPRWLPLLGWGVLFLVGGFGAYVLYQRPVAFSAAPPPPLPPMGPDVVGLALKDLEAIKASPWLRESGLAGAGSPDIIAPAPEAEVLAPDAAIAQPVDPLLKGAVVVSTGKRRYLVFGGKRYRTGARIGTGESIRALNLQSVELVSPEGRTRKVDIGRGIGPQVEPFTW